MARTFAYCRVSTADQTTDNQVREIEAAGFSVEPQRVIVETVSGSLPAMERRGFARLVDRFEAGDVLIVTKLDRLGRECHGRACHSRSARRGRCPRALPRTRRGGSRLPAGKMTMGVIAAVAEFERDLLVERTQSGLSRAKAQGKTLGRPSALTPEQQTEVLVSRAAGKSPRRPGALLRRFSGGHSTG